MDHHRASLLVAAFLATLATALVSDRAFAAATNLNWTGGGAIDNWYDVANWDGVNAPIGNTWQATINTAADLTFTNTAALTVNRVTTLGAGRVTLAFSSMSFSGGSGYIPSGGITIGPGGVRMNGAFSSPHGGGFITANGDFAASGTSWGNNGTIVQNAGQFAIGSLGFPIGMNPFAITNWSFTNNTPTTISTIADNASFRFDGSPVFANGHRPNWSFASYNSAGGGKWDLNGRTLLGSNVTVVAAGGFPQRYAWLTSTNGGAIDLHTLVVGNIGYLSCYIDLHGVALTLRGASGLVYDNRSINAAGTNLVYSGGAYTSIISKAYSIDDGTTVRFAPPTPSTQDLDTGSKDRGWDGIDLPDWTNNFAFHTIEINAGTTVRLVGDANIEGGGTNALYAYEILGLGAGATIDRNGHNVYVIRQPTTVIFTGAGMTYSMLGAGTVVLIK